MIGLVVTTYLIRVVVPAVLPLKKCCSGDAMLKIRLEFPRQQSRTMGDEDRKRVDGCATFYRTAKYAVGKKWTKRSCLYGLAAGMLGTVLVYNTTSNALKCLKIDGAADEYCAVSSLAGEG